MIKKYAIDGYKNVESKNIIGIFGNPIKHTMSPVIHDNLSYLFNIDEKYVPFHIEEKLKDRVNEAFDDGVLGLNITVPYKQEVMECLVDIDEDAKIIGAVNTLVRKERGYKGYNTDMPGLAKALLSENICLNGANVVMLGAGGAARAVAYMCGKYKANNVYIINRSYEKAKLLCDDMNNVFLNTYFCPIVASEYKDIPQNKYIFIQCTSVGLHQNDGMPFEFDGAFLDMAVAGVDLIYNPACTPFLAEMNRRGVKAVNGLKMLLYQGVLAYELWNNVEVTEEMTEKIYRKLSKAIYGKMVDKNNIVLVGYMGSGKSTVGKALASKMKFDFIDTDEFIEKTEGMTIREIFEQYGEDYFRNIETKTLQYIAENFTGCVVATGGGVPIKYKNRKILNEIGEVYFLDANVDTIYRRVSGNSNRPLLDGDDLYNKIENMLKVRTPMYKISSDYVIDTNNVSVDEIIDNIISFI